MESLEDGTRTLADPRTDAGDILYRLKHTSSSANADGPSSSSSLSMCIDPTLKNQPKNAYEFRASTSGQMACALIRSLNLAQKDVRERERQHILYPPTPETHSSTPLPALCEPICWGKT